MSSNEMDCLLLRGADGGPSGSYRPTGFSLTGSGSHLAADRFAHLHEAHHAALNDTTAWGTALHVSSRVPGLTGTFARLLRGCRRVHETFATAAPLSMLASEHPELDEYVRAGYPEYWRLAQAAESLIDVAPGPSRRYLLATQYARVCMQTPVLADLAAMLEAGPAPMELAPPRTRDTPDGRWAMLLQAGPELADRAVRAADAVAGASELVPDSLDPADDPIWVAWEFACYGVLADWLRAGGAEVLGFDGHQEPTRTVVDAALAAHPGIGLGAAVATGAARDDQQVAAAVLEQARHTYSTANIWAAAARPLNGEVVEDLVADPARIDGRAVLVLDARPAHRLGLLYDWGDATPTGDDVWVAVRRVRGEGSASGAGVSVIEHTRLESPDDAAALLDSWEHSSKPIACVSASCLVDQPWVEQWWRLLSGRCVAFVLLDVEAGRVTPGWVRTGGQLLLGRVEVNDRGVFRHVVAMRPSPGQPLWLSFHDDLGAAVFIQALRGTSGLQVESTAAHIEPLAPELQAVLTHLLATESFFDVSGLTGREKDS